MSVCLFQTAKHYTSLSNERFYSRLQAELPRTIFSEQIAIADVPTNHLDEPVRRRIYDRAFRSTSYGCANGVRSRSEWPMYFVESGPSSIQAWRTRTGYVFGFESYAIPVFRSAPS